MHGEDSAADALEDLLGDEVSSGAPLPTGKSGAIPKNIKPASPKGSGNDEGNAPSGPRTKRGCYRGSQTGAFGRRRDASLLQRPIPFWMKTTPASLMSVSIRAAAMSMLQRICSGS